MESGSGDISYSIDNTTSVNATGPSEAKFDFIVAIPSFVQLLLCGIILLIFHRVPSLRTTTNLPVVNLVTSDLVRAILGFVAIPVFSRSLNVKPSFSEDVLCKAFWYSNNVQFAWSSWAIAIVIYSRYDVIVNVLTPKFSKRKFWSCTGISWLVSLLTALLPFLGWSSYGFQRNADSYVCRSGQGGKGLLHAVYLPFFYFVNFICPTVLVILFFSRIVIVSKRYVKTHHTGNGSRTNVVFLTDVSQPRSLPIDEEQQKRWRTAANKTREIIRSKAFRYIVSIVMSNVLLLGPFVVVTCYNTVCSELGLNLRVSSIGSQIVALLFTLNFNLNSFLYVFWIRTFQRNAVALCCCSRHQTNS